MKKSIKISLIVLGVIVFIALSVFAVKYYNSNIKATKIAFVNFPEYMYADYAMALDSYFIQTHNFHKKDPLDDLKEYNVILVFGMGFSPDKAQIENLKQMMDENVPLHTYLSTTPEVNFSTLSKKELEKVEGYLKNPNDNNNKSLLLYSRKMLDSKSTFVEAPLDVEVFPKNYYFHPSTENYFVDLNDFQKYYEEQGLYTENAPKVLLLTSNLQPSNKSARDPYFDLIKELESRNINVYAATGFSDRVDFIKNVAPDLLIFIPHGRLAPGKATQVSETLSKLNIPVISPQIIFESHDDWLNNQMGLSGGMLAQNIIAPELDGVVNSLAIGAQFRHEDGVMVFEGIPERVKQFANLAENFLSLRTKKNKDKKVAVVYYKGPGQNALSSEGMEIVPSLLNLLRKLKSEGYQTGPLPKTSHELYDRIQKEGKLLGPYAKGSFEKFIKTGNPALIAADTLAKWMNTLLDPKLVKDVEKQYGILPGEYMTRTIDSTNYLAVARVQFGNVVLMPQPLPATGDNAFKLIHGTKKATPYPYIGTYLWAREGFKADALIHFGTHGSLEFTPFKQTGLSQLDWSDALIGDTPHFYIYTIGNVGEGMIAKRRSYATLLSHITPAFDESGFNSDTKKIYDAYNSYSSSQNSVQLKEKYENKLRKLIVETNLDKQLNLQIDSTKQLDEKQLEKIGKYVYGIEAEKITMGLYTLGKPYDKEKLLTTTRMMSIDPVAYAKAELDLLNGKISEEQKNDPIYFDKHYYQPAFKIINEVLSSKKAISIEKYIAKKDLQHLAKWEKENAKVNFSALMAGMISAFEKSPSPKEEAQETIAYNEERVTELMIKLLPDAKYKKALEKLKDPVEFKQSSKLLDRATIKKLKPIAKVVPKMQEVLDIMLQPDMYELLELLQNEKNYKLAMNIMEDDDILAHIKEKEQEHQKQIISKLTKPENMDVLFAATKKKAFEKEAKTWKKQTLEKNSRILDMYIKNHQLHDKIETSGQNEEILVKLLSGEKSLEILKESQKSIEQFINEINNKEKLYAKSVKELKEAIENIKTNYNNLKISPTNELEAVINGLNGGRIPPSSAGDAIRNPQAVPTGKNFYSINTENTPSEEAWELGVKMAKDLIATHYKKHNEYPKKIAYTLWGGEFIRGEGANLATILYLLGLEPIRSVSGRVKDVKLIPIESLKRPRIDVIVQTSGQFRDFASSRIFLINKAVKMAAEAQDGDAYKNYVSEGVLQMEKDLKDKGLTPEEAREFASARVFGGVNGNYGAAIMGLVESGDKWEDDKQIADQYIKNMGAIYTEDHWGEYMPGLFESSMKNTSMVVHPRSSNTWGPLSLDHVYEFMGGFTNAIKNTTGNDPDGYFADMRSRQNSFVQTVDEAIWTESQSTLFNPKYIGELMKGEASSAEVIAETTRDLYGWNVMKPSAVDNELWDKMYDVYVQDEYKMGIQSFFKKENPFAMQELTAVMLETVRKGYWSPSQEVINNIAELHTDLIQEYDAGCSGFVCNNMKLKDFISENISKEKQNAYNEKISDVRNVSSSEMQNKNIELKKVDDNKSLEEIISENKTISLMVLGIFFLFIIIFIVGRFRKS